jgi:hypothetical protein
MESAGLGCCRATRFAGASGIRPYQVRKSGGRDHLGYRSATPWSHLTRLGFMYRSASCFSSLGS